MKIIISFCFYFITAVSTNAASNEPIKIPFRYIQSFILIDIKLEGVIPMTLLFDTGAEHNIFFDKIYFSIFSDVYQRDVSILGSDLNEKIPAKITRPLNIKVAEKFEQKVECIVLDKAQISLSQIVGVEVHGILSASLFKEYKIAIDYSKGQITLYRKLSNYTVSKYTKHNISISKNKPYISCQIRMPNKEKKTFNLLLDSGAAISAMLYANVDTSIHIPQTVIPSYLGSGLGGTLHGVSGRLEEFCMDSSYCIYNHIYSFQINKSEFFLHETNIKQGIIGNHILEKFAIILDFSNQVIYLKPNRKFKKIPNYDKSGLYLSKGGKELRKFYVQNILPNSPADESKIKVGDEIISINRLPSSFYSLQKIQNILSKKEGKVVALRFKRNSIVYSTKLVLKELI